MNRSNGIADCEYPCPCSYYGDPTKECTCAPSMVTRYQKRTSEAGLKVSGPLLDPLRVDIHVEVPRVPYEKLTGERLGEPSSVVATRVEAARDRQRKRFASHDSRVMCNADTRSGRLMCGCYASWTRPVNPSCDLPCSNCNSPRERSIACSRSRGRLRAFGVAGSDEIAPAHLAEAIQYRPRRQE